MVCRALIPDLQPARVGRDGGPDVLASQTLAYAPGLVEDRNRAIGCDAAQEMDPTGRDWQRLGQMRDLVRCQVAPGFAALSGLGSALAEFGWGIVGHVPMHKLRAGSGDTAHRTEATFVEEGVAPQPVQLLDVAVAVGLGHRQENQLDAHRQAQPHELTENPRDLVAATEGSVVVELQKVRDSQPFPGFQHMADQRGGALVGRDRLGQAARVQIESMKGIDLGAIVQIATGPIERVHNACDRRQRAGTISRARCGQRPGQTRLVQHAFDRRQRWQLSAQFQLAQFAPDGAWANQADGLLAQPAARLHDQTDDPRRTGAGAALRSPRLAFQSAQPTLAEAFSPFAQPGAAALYSAQDVFWAGAFQP